MQTDPNAGLGRQALRRQLTPQEERLGAALEQIFRSGVQDLQEVAAQLQQSGVPLPSGAAGPWTLAALERELTAINASLDRSYAGG